MFLSSLYFALLAKRKIWQTTETYSPQTFSVTAAVVAPAAVICLKTTQHSQKLIQYTFKHCTKIFECFKDERMWFCMRRGSQTCLIKWCVK